jgi:hypothetical protein
MNPNPADTFVDRCKGAGFSPAQTLWLINEQRFVGAGLWVNPDVAIEPDIARGLEARARLAKAVMGIDSPETMASYRKDWAHHYSGVPLDGKIDQTEMIGLFTPLIQHKDFRLPFLYGENNREELIERLSGAWKFQPTQMEKDIADTDPDWDDVGEVWRLRQPVWANADHPVQKAEGVSLDEARQVLAAASSKAGIAMLAWPTGVREDVPTLLRLASEVEHASLQLTRRFGLPQDTELLGLGKTVTIALGFEDDAGGTCANSNATCLLSLNGVAGWKALSHEWFHGLDAWFGRQFGYGAVMASDAIMEGKKANPGHEENIKTFRSLLEGLSGKNVSPAHQSLWDEMKDTWVDRWTDGMPHLANAVQVEREAMEKEDWTKEAAVARWTEAFVGADRPNPAIAAWMLATELVMVRHHESHLDRQPGYVFREEFRENIVRQKEFEWVGDYLNYPCELLAHNFETGFGRNAGFADAAAGHTTLRYPLKGEEALQTLNWRRFFKAVGPTLQKAFSPVQDLNAGSVVAIEDTSLRLAARRQAQLSHNPVPAVFSPDSSRIPS